MGLIFRVEIIIILLFFAVVNIFGGVSPDSSFYTNSALINDTIVNSVLTDSSGFISADTSSVDSLLANNVSMVPIAIDTISNIPIVRDSVPVKNIPRDTVKYWKKGGCLTVNVSQVALSSWASGGENSIAANSLLNLNANYAKSNVAWDNNLDFGFGRLKRENTKAVKTDDKIDFSTKYGRRIANKWYYSALLNFKSQLFPGYYYPEKDSVKISDFLSPGTVFLSVGIDFKPSDKFTFLLSSLTGKTTIVKSNLLSRTESFGVDSGKHFRHEFGGYMKLIKKGSLLKYINYQLKLDAFSNYMEKPENIDWDCELTIWARLNKFITANLKANILYDDDIVTSPNKGPRLQIREFIGVGFSYRF